MSNWQEASKQQPCPICGKPDWCSVSADGQMAICRRLDDGAGRRCADAAGADYWVYRRTGQAWGAPPEAITTPLSAGDAASQCADADTLHRVYSALLDSLGLSGPHRADLQRRGLSGPDIDRHGYRTLPDRDRAALARRLVEAFGVDIARQIPGLYIREQDGRSWWSLAGAPGILIPVRDIAGRIVALKTRADAPPESGGRYRWLSSRAHGGPGPGSRVHVPLRPAELGDECRLTEGELKADIATTLSGLLTISIPGVSHWRAALPVLGQLGVRLVRLAFDADAHTNPTVARALRCTIIALQDAGYQAALEQWAPAHKGIDDLLAAGLKPVVIIEAREVRRTADEIANAAGADDPPAILRRIEEIAASESPAEALFGSPEILGSLAAVRRADPAQWALIRKQLKGHINLSDLDRAVRRQGLQVLRPGDGPPPSGDDPGTLPQVMITHVPLRHQSAAALDHLMAANDPPAMFIRSGGLARVGRNEDGLPILEPLTESALRGRLARCVEFVRATERATVPVAPPLDVVRDIASLGQWPFPPVQGIIETPTIDPNGRVIDQPGYDAATRLCYMPAPEFAMPPVPDAPSSDRVTAARALLEEIICDFPFVDDAARANLLAALITPIIRPMIDGPIPMAIVDKPQAGTGSSLLAETIGLLATGRAAAMLSAPKEEEEWEKRIFGLLWAGRTVVVVDNVEGKLFAPALAMALTASTYQGRVLGRSEMMILPQRATWIATGNNIRLGGDLPRRCYWVRLDAQVARPWQRSGFRHPDLLGWVRAERGRLLAAVLTIARAWHVAGRPVPAGLPVLGGFDGWARVVGGMLAYCGIEGFLGNLEAMYEQADDDTAAWEAFLTGWLEYAGGGPITVAEIVRRLRDCEEFRTLLPDELADGPDSKGFQRRLGWGLRKRNGQRFPRGLVVEKAGSDHQAVKWRVRGETLFENRPANEVRNDDPW